MRLDLFLKLSGLIRRRSDSHEACLSGNVTVNGARARPGRQVRVDDVIAVRRGGGEPTQKPAAVVRVRSVPSTSQVSRADRKALYEILDGFTDGDD
ncbi:hypothetical protein JW921_08990 [Candidatus Fermentibacterales bacterium]|nr:hypothetical protein [Candidatus Fermentibacterales bacterium]